MSRSAPSLVAIALALGCNACLSADADGDHAATPNDTGADQADGTIDTDTLAPDTHDAAPDEGYVWAPDTYDVRPYEGECVDEPSNAEAIQPLQLTHPLMDARCGMLAANPGPLAVRSQEELEAAAEQGCWPYGGQAEGLLDALNALDVDFSSEMLVITARAYQFEWVLGDGAVWVDDEKVVLRYDLVNSHGLRGCITPAEGNGYTFVSVVPIRETVVSCVREGKACPHEPGL